jgi:hypothetical protein
VTPLSPYAPAALANKLSKKAHSIDEVVDRLSEIIGWALNASSRLGYFAALYRKVTVSVREGIRRGSFDDGVRMERFDVIFANRYLDALHTYSSGGRPSPSWQLAFESAADFWPIVLQHLLLGMNAHINLDLGIAAAETMRGRNLEDIRNDFNQINQVLASLVDDVQDELSAVWKPLRIMNRFLGTVDDAIVNFSMKRARDEAWRNAQALWPAPAVDWPGIIGVQDKKALTIGTLVRNPGFGASSVTRIIRVGELKSARQVIEILC